jgi:hypothetical protein
MFLYCNEVIYLQFFNPYTVIHSTSIETFPMPEHQQIQQSKKPDTTFQKQSTPIKQIPLSNPMAIIQRAKINPKSLTPADVMQLQRTIGNRAVGKLLSEIGLVPSTVKPVQRQEIPEEQETCPSCVQRQEITEEEEPLQGKMIKTIQRQEIPEEEESLQGKMIGTIQRQEIPEEEELLQGKMAETIQLQDISEEEETLQDKFESKPEMACPSCFAAPTVQRQEIPEEEEPIQGKMIEPVQRQEIPEEEEPLQGKMVGTIQRQEIPEEEESLQTKRENNTGMPNNLKAGVESLSGIDMNDVRVHYNSDKPAELGALAYTQGADIHLASGQERHLPHEAWHVVQQAQGKVKPTIQLKDGVSVNDDEGLEHEADVMGAKALQMKSQGDKSQSLANEVFQMPSGENAFQIVDNRPIQHQAFSLIGSNQKVPANYPQRRLQNQNVAQKKFEEGKEPIEKAIDALAYSTGTGRVAMEAGEGKLTVNISSEWKALTQGRIGIGIPEKIFNILKEWGGGPANLKQKDEYAVLVAHELTHIRHCLVARGTYAVRGLKSKLSNWGSQWDADPEEELTITGITKVSKAEWKKMYDEALECAGFNKKKDDKIRYQGDIEKPSQSDSLRQKYEKKIKKLDEEMKEILLQYDEVPKNAREEGDFYIFEDEFTENTSRKEKGFKKREKYAESGFEKE